MSTIVLQNQEIPLNIRKSARARRISLRINHDGEVTVTVPRWTAKKQGINFAQQKADWILKHLQRIESQKPQRPPIFHSGQQLTLFGESTLHLLITPTAKRRPYYQHQSSILNCFIPHHLGNETQPTVRSLIEKFYRQTALTHLTARTEHYAQLLGTNFNSIRLKDQKTRWGSCSKLKNLNYNYRIILAPHQVIDYLVAHEVCHLKQMNHSPKFWALVSSLMPDYQVHQKWLRKNGARLRF